MLGWLSPLPCGTCTTLPSSPCLSLMEGLSREREKQSDIRAKGKPGETQKLSGRVFLLGSVVFLWCDAPSTSLRSIPMRSQPCHTDRIHWQGRTSPAGYRESNATSQGKLIRRLYLLAPDAEGKVRWRLVVHKIRFWSFTAKLCCSFLLNNWSKMGLVLKYK